MQINKSSHPGIQLKNAIWIWTLAIIKHPAERSARSIQES